MKIHKIETETKESIEQIREKITPLEKEHKQEIREILKEFKESLSLLHEAATRDEKTGLYNNRFFKSIFEMEIERAKREKQDLCLAIVDIDFFKKLNDTYGHLLGDEILVALAKKMTKELRKYDLISRFGGEEFFILLPEENIAKAKRVTERLRKSLWKNSKLKKYKVTISIGVTEYKQRDNMERMIKRADKALYVSKENGRNQVNVA